MTLLTTILAILAGASWFAGITNLIVGLRQSFNPTNLTFALLAFVAGLHALVFIPLHHAPDLEHYVAAMRWALLLSGLIFAALPWFAHFYTGTGSSWQPLMLSSIYLAIALANVFVPHGVFFNGPPQITQFAMPWGELVTNHTGMRLTPGAFLFWGTHIFLFSYIYRACVIQYRRGQRRNAVALAVSTSIILIGVAANIAINMAGLRMPFIGEFTFVALVLLMMFWLSNDERFRALFTQASEGIFLADNDGRYIDVNAAGAALLGYTREELRGKHVLDVVVPEDSDVEGETRSLFAGRILRSEWTFRRKDGSTFPGELSGRMLSDGRLLGLVRDMSEHRMLMRGLEERVAARTAEYAELNRQLESFSYSVSHDLRAPVRAISGFTGMLLQNHSQSLDAEARRHLSRIDAAAAHMNELIEGLLQLARVSHHKIHDEEVDLSQLAQEVVLRLRERESKRRVTFTSPQSLSARGDERLLRIVVHNLIENAWKYTSNTEDAVIELGRNAGRDEVIYFVRDNGAGFDMKYSERLFEPFQRLHSTNEFAGTGIGLATVARVVQRHGGKIWAEAAPGKGATFYFTLANRRAEAVRRDRQGVAG